MGRQIDLSWRGPGVCVDALAELADEQNPELCEDFWGCLPFTVLQDHPVVSGESMYCWVPLVSTAAVHVKEAIHDAPPGRIRYSQNTGNKIVIQYGKALEPILTPVLGRVLPDSLRKLPEVGKAVWESTFQNKDLIWITVSRHGDANRERRAGGNAGLKHEVARRFAAEAETILTTEPNDMRQLRLGLVESAGSFGQYFSTWEIANGMVRDYIMYTIYPLLRLCDTVTPQQMAAALDAFVPPYSGYLGYSGFKTLERLSDELRAAMHKAKTAEEARDLLKGFLLYGNRLSSWAFHYFPWYLGIFFKRVEHEYGDNMPGRWSFDEGVLRAARRAEGK